VKSISLLTLLLVLCACDKPTEICELPGCEIPIMRLRADGTAYAHAKDGCDYVQNRQGKLELDPKSCSKGQR
jgi:hypothetical protein